MQPVTPQESVQSSSDISAQIGSKIGLLGAVADNGSMLAQVKKEMDSRNKILPDDPLNPGSLEAIFRDAFEYSGEYPLVADPAWDSIETSAIEKRQRLVDNPENLAIVENSIAYLEKQGLSVQRKSIHIAEANGFLAEGQTAMYLESDDQRSQSYIVPYDNKQLVISFGEDQDYNRSVKEGFLDEIKNDLKLSIRIFVPGEYDVNFESQIRPS